MEVRSADIGIDLGAQPLSNPNRAKFVMMIARDNHFAASHQLADTFGGQPFVLCHFNHLFGYLAFACRFQLSHRMFLKMTLAGHGCGLQPRPRTVRSTLLVPRFYSAESVGLWRAIATTSGTRWLCQGWAGHARYKS